MKNYFKKWFSLTKSKRKALSLILVFSLLVSILPIASLLAWSPAGNVTINKTKSVSYFSNQWGTSLTTGFYYLAGTNEVAYCGDQEATGPGGTGYALNDGGLNNADYLAGVQAAIQNGWPAKNNGLSDDDARYATQIAIHWLENYYLGAGEGYDASIRSTTRANGHDGALAFALALYDAGVAQTRIYPRVHVGEPSAWTNVGGVLTCSVQVNQSYTDHWEITELPDGVTPVGGTIFSGDVNLILQLTDPAAYAADATKTISAVGYSNNTISNIHVFTTGGGYQTMIARSTGVEGLDPDSVTLADASGQIRINKTTERGSGNVSAEVGATFQIYSSAYANYAAAPDSARDTITTDASGSATTKDLPFGDYIAHQTAAPTGVWLAGDTLISLPGGVVTANITNTTANGTITIQKSTNHDGTMLVEPGATFEIFLTSAGSYDAASATERDTITTDASGAATTKALPYGSYTVRQTVAPIGTLLNASTWTVDVGTSSSTGAILNNDNDTLSITNDVTHGKLEIDKTTDLGFAQVEPGATFEVYSSAFASYAAAPVSDKDTITTAADGTAVTKDLPYGTYTVHQSVAPVGTKPVADFTVVLGTTNGEVVRKAVVNQTYWGDIQVLKYKSAPSDTTGTLIPEPDASFRIYPSSFASWDAAMAGLSDAQKSVLTDTITSGLMGTAKTTHQLPYGEYTVEQIDTVANLTTFKVDSWQVTIGAADNQTYTYVRNNKIYEQYLAVIKTDAKTGKIVKIAGATFQVLAEDGVTVLKDKNGVDSFVTDANGRIDIKNLALQVGKYFVKEVKAPLGYAISTEPKAFAVSISDHGSSLVTIDYGVDIRSILFPDIAQTCQLVIEKQGEVLTSATQMATDYTDETGTALSVYDFGYTVTGKPGAVFEASVGATDIVDGDGIPCLYDTDKDGVAETEMKAGASLGTITTAAVLQKDGTTRYIASLADLPLDAKTGTAQYVLKEVTAPKGDLVNSTPLIYNFSYSDQTLTQIVQDQSMTDTRQKVQITVEKQKEAGTWNKATGDFDWPTVAAPQILFGLFAANDITDPDGNVLVKADSLVDVLYTDADGIGKTTGDLPFGNYYAKELNVTSDVVYDGVTQYPITAEPTSDQTIPTAVFALNDGKTIVNRQIAGTMEIYKYAKDTNLPMPGVVFEVYDKTGNLVDTVTTAADGTAVTRVLPYGLYTLVETKTTTGYALSENTSFSIWIMPTEGEKYSTDEMTVANEKKAQIEVFKTTADGKETPLANVVFGVFAKSDDSLVTMITTDAKGYGSAYVAPGDYYMKEIKTVDGYALSSEKLDVKADWAGVYKFKVTNDKTTVTLNKTDVNTSEGVPGAEITIKDSTGTVVSKTTTGKDGKTTIEGLKPGTYTFQETLAPTGYYINTTIFTFTIDEYGKVTGQSTIVDAPAMLIVKKTSTTSSKGLPGMEFTVTDTATGSLVSFVWSKTLSAYVPTGATILEGANLDASTIGNVLMTGADGTAKILYLPSDGYKITEVKAPAGYKLDSTPAAITIGTQDAGSNGVTITMKNSPIVTKTGEKETALSGLAGLALLGASALLVVRRRHRKINEVIEHL